MTQLRLHTLNRHCSNCLMDIILKAYIISKALEILVASYQTAQSANIVNLMESSSLQKNTMATSPTSKQFQVTKSFQPVVMLMQPSESMWQSAWMSAYPFLCSVSKVTFPELRAGNFIVDGSFYISEWVEKEFYE